MKVFKIKKTDRKTSEGDADPQKVYQSINQNWTRCISDIKRIKTDMELDADEVEDMKSSERSKAFASDLTETLGDLEKNIKSLSDQVVKTKNVLRGI